MAELQSAVVIVGMHNESSPTVVYRMQSEFGIGEIWLNQLKVKE
jgi:hypothetical protein